MFGDKRLAELTRTPVHRPGLRAFDITYANHDDEGKMIVLTDGSNRIGNQIRTTLFTHHPEATDYTFEEFDYRAFQKQLAADYVARLVRAQVATYLTEYYETK